MRFALLTLMCVITPNIILAATFDSHLLEKIAKRSISRIDILSSLTQNYTRISPAEIIERENFPSETHRIITEDGYILTVYRIPGPPSSTPVLLQHGLLDSSASWLLQGKRKSLPFILSRHGYDVWLGNARGNTYSRSHRNLSTTDPRFWNFSIEELGKYDLPAVINYITDLKRDSLFYIGHSMGGTSFSVMAIERPDVAKKVKAMIALAPGTYGYHTRNVFKLLAPFWKEFMDIAYGFGIREFSPHTALHNDFAKYVCTNKLLNGLCEFQLFFLAGFNHEKFDTSLLPKIYRSFPAGTSTKLITYFLQQANVDKFRRFDYGLPTNLKVYNSREPPLFDLSKVRVPIAAFWAANDWFVGPQDVKKFYSQVPLKLGIFEVKDIKYNHLDFLWAKDAAQLVYEDILNVMTNYTNGINGNQLISSKLSQID